MVWLVVIGSILYAALWWTMPLWPDLTVPISLGVALGTSAVPRTAGLAALASWLIGRVLLGPGQWLLFTGYYNEPVYLDILNADRPPSLLATLAGGVLAAGAAELVARKVLQRRERLICAGGIVALLMAGFIPRIDALSPTLRTTLSVEPADEQYTFDPQMLLKTVYLMRQGHGYYEAYRVSLEKDQRPWNEGFQGGSIRTPILFWMWAALPSGGDIAVLSWAFAISTMGAAFVATARRLAPAAAVLAPALLAAYYMYANMNWWVMIPDLWAGYAVVLSFCAWMLEWRIAAIVLALIAFLARELTGFYMGSLLIVSLVERRQRETVASLIALGLAAAAYAINNHFSQASLGISIGGTLTRRLGGSVAFSFTLTRFGAIIVAGRDLVMPVLTLASLTAPFWRPRAPWALVLALTVAMALIAFTWVGESEYGQYYAFMYGPLLVLGGAVTLGTRLDTAEPA